MSISIKDVAKRAGVSIGTVSRYINGASIKEVNEKKIKEAIEFYNYKVNLAARNLKTRKTMTVAVILSKLRYHFSSILMSCLQSNFLSYGYNTIFFDLSDDVAEQVEQVRFICGYGVDGIIVMPIETDVKLSTYLSQIDIPKVVIENVFKKVVSDVVLIDNMNASYNAVEWFITNKHKKIGILCGPKVSYSAEERLRGYIRVLEDYRMPLQERYILYGKYTIDYGYENMRRLLKAEDRPTAVLATNCELTIGALKAVNEAGLSIPYDLSFIGFDNQDIAEVIKPGISIVRQPISELGEESVKLLVKRMNGNLEDFPTLKRLKTDFLSLSSVAVLPVPINS